MLPEIFSLGPFTLHSYGVLIALGVLLSFFLMIRTARQFGFPPVERVFDLMGVVALAGFLGARLFYVAQEWDWYREHPFEIVQIWKGGLVYYGGMPASFAAFFLYVRRHHLPFLASTDFVLPYVALTHALGRVGCFLNGCCYGKICEFPWAVKFPLLPHPVHPTQLYEAGFNALLFGFLSWFYPRRRFPGEVTALYLIFYPAGRFLVEYLRGDQVHGPFPLTFHQGLSLIFLAGGAVLYGTCRRPR